MNTEATRCLQCKNPLCRKGCPVSTEIPTIISLYKDNKLQEAGEMLFNNNPLSAVCSIVCNWKAQCNGHCVLAIKGEGVRFYEIEQEISVAYLKQLHLTKPATNNLKVAIVGGGPVGIASAIELAKQGCEVTLYEKKPLIGGVLRYGIPPFRLSKDIVDEYGRLLNELGVTVKCNTTIGKNISLKNLTEENDSVVIGVGVGKAKELGVEGEHLSNVHSAIDYLADPNAYDLKEPVIVIGGGNVAIDAARTAVRSGKETHIFYRKTFENMPASKIEVDEAKDDGVLFDVFEAPMEFKANSAIFAKTENKTDENGKVYTNILEGTNHEVACGDIIYAVSQTTEDDLYDEVEFNKRALLTVDELGRTSLAKVYGAGDVVLGAKTVVDAVATAKKVCATLLQDNGKGANNE